jgi:hypothetical protein
VGQAAQRLRSDQTLTQRRTVRVQRRTVRVHRRGQDPVGLDHRTRRYPYPAPAATPPTDPTNPVGRDLQLTQQSRIHVSTSTSPMPTKNPQSAESSAERTIPFAISGHDRRTPNSPRSRRRCRRTCRRSTGEAISTRAPKRPTRVAVRDASGHDYGKLAAPQLRHSRRRSRAVMGPLRAVDHEPVIHRFAGRTGRAHSSEAGFESW